MENKKLKISVLLITILIASLGIYSIWANVGPKSTGLAGDKQEFSLLHPAFAQSVAVATTFLDQEAGIAVYLNAGKTLNLDVAISKLHGPPESNTSLYVVGSIAIPTNPSQNQLPSSEDAHCFVHKEGWIVIYYRNTESTAKIIDWNWWDANGLTLTGSMNKLQAALEKMGTALSLTLPFIHANQKYCDFRYPDATKLTLAIKMQPSGNIPPNPVSVSFNIELPGNFTFFSESWSHYRTYPHGVGETLTIDGNLVDTLPPSSSDVRYGDLSPLVQDTFHTVSLNKPSGGQYFDNHICCILFEYKESV